MLRIALFVYSLFPRFLLVFFYDAIKPFSQKFFLGLRYCIIKNLFKTTGQRVIIGPNVTIKNWKGISVGNNVSIHDGSYIDGYGGITIGNNVSIAHQCSLLSTSHTWANAGMPIRNNPVENKPLVIGDNIWLGCAVRLMGGVTVANNVIVGAGSVVTKSLSSNGIYLGSPAKFYKEVYPAAANEGKGQVLNG
jgi:acetyltransferase-like isoleucine patch superfamily enzyme